MKNDYFLYLLLDSNNMGVLYVSQNSAVINYLKDGFLEGTSRTLFPQKDLSGAKFDPSTHISEQELQIRNVYWGWKGKTQRLSDLPIDHITEDFLLKKKLALLRAPMINKIHRRTTISLNDKAINMPLFHSVDSALQNAIDQCSIEKGIFHRDILEVARIRNWTPEMAYKDIKLKLDSSNSAKIKIYALNQKFVNLVNNCSTVEEISAVEEEYDNITIRNQRV